MKQPKLKEFEGFMPRDSQMSQVKIQAVNVLVSKIQSHENTIKKLHVITKVIMNQMVLHISTFVKTVSLKVI